MFQPPSPPRPCCIPIPCRSIGCVQHSKNDFGSRPRFEPTARLATVVLFLPHETGDGTSLSDRFRRHSIVGYVRFMYQFCRRCHRVLRHQGDRDIKLVTMFSSVCRAVPVRDRRNRRRAFVDAIAFVELGGPGGNRIHPAALEASW
jgi:hypothetical protein